MKCGVFRIVTPVRHSVQKRCLMPAPEPVHAAAAADTGGAVPAEMGMPVFIQLHHLWPALIRITLHRGQHIHNMLAAGGGLFRRVCGHIQPVLAGGPRYMPFPAQRRPHRPDPGLHHQARQVPDRLNFNDAAFIKAKKFMKAQMRNLAGGRNPPERGHKPAKIIARTAHPVLAHMIRTRDTDQITSFHIRQCRS